jgi:hypothetical protein
MRAPASFILEEFVVSDITIEDQKTSKVAHRVVTAMSGASVIVTSMAQAKSQKDPYYSYS